MMRIDDVKNLFIADYLKQMIRNMHIEMSLLLPNSYSIFENKINAMWTILYAIHLNRYRFRNVLYSHVHVYALVWLHLIKNVGRRLKNGMHVHTFHKEGNAWLPAVSAPVDPNTRGAQPFSMIFFTEHLVHADARSGRNDEKDLSPHPI